MRALSVPSLHSLLSRLPIWPQAGACRTRILKNGDFGRGGRYCMSTFSHPGGFKAILGNGAREASQYVPRLFIAQTNSRVAALTLRHMPDATITDGILKVGGRTMLEGWHRDDFMTKETLLSASHYVVQQFPLNFKTIAEIRDAELLSPEAVRITWRELTTLRKNGTITQTIPRGHSVFRLCSGDHRIRDGGKIPQIKIESVVCNDVEGTITFNYSLSLEQPHPDEVRNHVSPAVYVAVDTRALINGGQGFTLKTNLIESEKGTQP